MINNPLSMVMKKIQEGIDSRHSDYHIMNVSYVLNTQIKTSCTVIRNLTDNAIWFNTDFRSQKVVALEKNNQACLHFYSKKDKIQMSVACTLVIHHHDDFTKQAWEKASLLSKQCYRQIGPPCDAYHEETAQLKLPLKTAYENFATVEATMHTIDVLFLKFGGNERYLIDMHTKHCQSVLP